MNQPTPLGKVTVKLEVDDDFPANETPQDQNGGTEKGTNKKTPAKAKMNPAENHQQSLLPHRLSSLTRSIVEFAKFMMGTSGPDYRLPEPPTTEELKAFEVWNIEYLQAMDNYHRQQAAASSLTDEHDEGTEDQAERERLKKQALEEFEITLQSSHYLPAPLPTNNYEITQVWKDQCDAQFRLKGFPRITFQWNKPNLDSSSWNNRAAIILAIQWQQWYLQHRRYSSNVQLKVDAKGVIGRWLKTSACNRSSTHHNNSNNINSELPFDQQTEETRRLAEFKRQHEIRKEKIGRLRYATAKSCIPKQQGQYIIDMVKDPGLVSDYEDDPSNTETHKIPSTRILPFWRSKPMTDLLHELDVAAIQLSPNLSLKNYNLSLLGRKDVRESSEYEVLNQVVPLGLHKSAIDTDFYNDNSILERKQLQIDNTNKPYSLNQALVDLQLLTCKTNAIPISID
ncbi:hypothetical protein MJO28_006352 [Puccinia striiformis f. sp. tritici]|uniref:Uncharacterized protein n=2 Tax=Puccinia striiformis TaxID=27350 RepID=A0A2S4VSB2_9BASI|nr:hypothetical protein Pst134EA_011531 [Puccinia striiformis f. sp. tritici]KAH9467911.1 hypothetical protein Pst134EA_011531 [Puccinia striiformis f. sp. tritici]KAI7953805.1 hypothetical protein MJO28_006352 [Puccinia striiformis f. sp. tritici]KAI7958107.1 hypothetical protein MJO29_006324 [Puccinia striiformis f. sp. tritici]POW12427.1 hypothetical protein PSTT_04482 [Puccinia striiformis]